METEKKEMNSTDRFLEFFHSHGNILTLGEIMKTAHICEYRKHISLLRHRGYKIVCVENRKEPSKNTYTLAPCATPSPVHFSYDQAGQGAFG